MSGGPSSVYFHLLSEGHELGTGRDDPGDYLGCPAPIGPELYSTIPQSPLVDQPSGMESMYAPGPYAGGGSTQRYHASATTDITPSPSTIPLHRTEMQSTTIHLHAAATDVDPFTGPASHTPQASRLHNVPVHHFDCSGSGSNSLFVGRVPGDGLQDLGSKIPSSHNIAGTSPLGFISTSQSWGETAIRTTFSSLVHPSHPAQVHSWEPRETAQIQPPSLVSNDISPRELIYPQNTNADDDASDDACTFLCEWTDEHGTCNMGVLGDRVWMSHHLSRHHNVVGNERSQRPCLWLGCTDTMNKGSLARHIVSRHLRAGASCGYCSKMYSRADVARRHTKKCKVANGLAMEHENYSKW